MSRQFNQTPKGGAQQLSKLGRGYNANNGGDNSDFFLLGNFEQSGSSAQDIDPEILREESEQSARQAAANVEGVNSEEQNNGQTKNEKHVDASRIIHDDGLDIVDDVGLKPDFNALAVAAKLMEAAGDDLMTRKNGGSSSSRYNMGVAESAQVAAAVAQAAKQHEQRQQQREREREQQQRHRANLQHQKYPYNSGFPNDSSSSQNPAHNLFNERAGGESNDLAENYAQYLRAHQDPKVQQDMRLRQHQHHLLGARNNLDLAQQQQQIAAAATAAAGNSSNQILMNAPHHAINGKRRIRLRWSEEETKALIDGCKMHGVGNWKKILTDPHYRFNNRTAVDLKDRFRTSFPEEYSRLYPNARTHKSKRKAPPMEQSSLVKINRKERRSFTREEDQRLLEGFDRHGAAWSKIQRDETLGLGDRRSTDLRDRFRNAFPEQYIAAGYKGRGNAKRTLQTLPNDADQDSYINHNLDSAQNSASGSGGDYPLIPSIGNGDYGVQSGDRSSSNNVQMSPSFKDAAAAFANSNIEELTDAKHQESVMSSIKLEGLNGDDDDDEDADGLTSEERQRMMDRQLEIELEREQKRQEAAAAAQKNQQSQGSPQLKEEHARSESPTILAAAAAAAIAASVDEGVDVIATSGTERSGIGKSSKVVDEDDTDGGANASSNLSDSLLYNPLYYNNSSGHSR